LAEDTGAVGKVSSGREDDLWDVAGRNGKRRPEKTT